MNFEFNVGKLEYCAEKLQMDQLSGILGKLSKRVEPWLVMHSEDGITVIAPSEDVTFTSGSYRLFTFSEAIHEGNKPELIFRVTEYLAGANLSFLPLSSFARFHILVHSEDAALAEKILRSIKVVK
jgi:hypothetical protein